MVFKAGQSGNPAGKPKGARHRLGFQFLEDLQQAWETKGKEVIEQVIKDRPQDFLKVVANLLPKEFHVKSDVQELTDDELTTMLNALRSASLAQITAGLGSGTEKTQRH